MSEPFVYVWDKFVRFFHWSLTTVFILLYCSANYEYDDIHFLLAYLLVLLLIGRIVWGFIAPRHAHFSNFTYPMSETTFYLKALVNGNTQRYLGHNPAGALMIFAFFLLLILMTVTGFIMLTWGEYEGPLWAIGIDFSDITAKVCRQIHEICTNLLLVLIAFHLMGVALSSFKHRENLVSAMWHGKKKNKCKNSA